MPWLSNETALSRRSSNASWYCKPEQPPPRTPTRRPATSAPCGAEARNSWTFSAPLSDSSIIAFQSIAVGGYTDARMPSAEQIKQRIEAAIPGARADVEDYTGGGDHFRATVTAAAFDGRSRIEQHRLVYEVFGAEIGDAIHALSLKTQAPRATTRGSRRRS